MEPKSSNAASYFKPGQLWQLKDSQVRIDLVGKTLVHYKQFKVPAKAGRVELANKAVLQAYLTRQHAVLAEG